MYMVNERVIESRQACTTTNRKLTIPVPSTLTNAMLSMLLKPHTHFSLSPPTVVDVM